MARVLKREIISAPLLLLWTSLLVSCPMSQTRVSQPTAEDITEEFETAEQMADAEQESAEDQTVDGMHDDGGSDVGQTALWEEIERGRAVAFDDGPLAPFFVALRALEDHGDGLVRVLHYGDSHTAADFLTSEIRHILQQRFGNGGRGFVILGRPWRSYNPLDVVIRSRGRWRPTRFRIGGDPAELDGRWGLAGVAMEGQLRGAAAAVSSQLESPFARPIDVFDLFFLRQPGGGAFSIHVDGKQRRVVQTGSSHIQSGFSLVKLNKGAREIEVRLRGNGSVRLFGIALETEGPGVVYDTLGINGAFFTTPHRWDAQLLAAQIARRTPDLIVTMYGTNDTLSRILTPRKYSQDIKQTIRRLRAGAPGAACLMIGPVDCTCEPPKEGSPSQLDWVIEVQQRTAEEIGCAFLDTREIMGGPGSRRLWEFRELAHPDGIHLTKRGYQLLGRLLADRILTAYTHYLEEISDPPTIEEEE